MKSTKFWVAVAAVLLAALLAATLLSRRGGEGTVADLYQDGVLLRSIDLSQVEEPYSFVVDGPAGGNTVEVERGRIRVADAGCPDHICVEQGWISDSAAPIVCLPNRLVIQIEGGPPADVDGVTG